MCTSRHSFTLTELLIVVSIIAILAAVALPNVLMARVRAKIAAAKAQIHTCVYALENYRIDNGTLPSARYYCLALGEGIAKNYYELPWELTTPVPYLSERPIDPFNRFPGARQDAVGQPMKYRRAGSGYFNDMPTEEGLWVPKAFPIDDGDYVFFNNASEQNPASRSPIEYGVWSVGPVPKTEIGLHTLEPVPSHTWYDASNGAVSSGIIVRLNTGHHAP